MNPRPIKLQDDAFDRCVDLAREGRVTQALEGLRRALEAQALHPQHRAAAVDALTRIARMATAAGDLENAGRALEEAQRAAPRFADVHYRMALHHLATHRRPEARRALNDALRINPRYLAARVELALIDAREGLLGEAIATFRQMATELEIDQSRLFHRGMESLEHADWEEGGALLKQALQLDEPGVHEAVEEFHTRMSRGDRAGAAELARRALRGYPGYADLHCLVGIAELEEGHLDDALSSLARAIELHPDYHAARVHLARALEALGDLAQAEEQVGLVLEADPQHPLALELTERWKRLHRKRGRGGGATRKGSVESREAS